MLSATLGNLGRLIDRERASASEWQGANHDRA
jgi:hypothetical protein